MPTQNSVGDQFRSLYADFVEAYRIGSVSPEEVGLVVAKLANFYAILNYALNDAERANNRRAAGFFSAMDPDTGKPMAASKVEFVAKATDEYEAVAAAKRDILSLEQCINALKTLQRGITQDFHHSSSADA